MVQGGGRACGRARSLAQTLVSPRSRNPAPTINQSPSQSVWNGVSLEHNSVPAKINGRGKPRHPGHVGCISQSVIQSSRGGYCRGAERQREQRRWSETGCGLRSALLPTSPTRTAHQIWLIRIMFARWRLLGTAVSQRPPGSAGATQKWPNGASPPRLSIECCTGSAGGAAQGMVEAALSNLQG